MKKTKDNAVKTKYSKHNSEKRAAARKLTSRIFTGAAIALALVFIVFIFVTTNFMGSDNIVTESAQKTIVSDTISTTGFVIRDEVLIENDSNGVLVYQVASGDKVTAKGTIATVYDTENDAVNYQRLCDIEEEIAELEELNNVLSSANVGLDTVNNRLDQKLSNFIETINKRDFNNISSVENELFSAIYRKQIITGDQENFDEKIAELNDQKTALENTANSSSGEITSKYSGCFVSDIDGYEGLFSTDDLGDIYYSDISDPERNDVDEDKYVGKVIRGVNWYLACPITSEQAVAISHNNTTVNVKIPYASNESMPAKVVSINELTDEKMAVVILECNYMSPALSQIRNEAVDIELNTYEGLKVRKTALHDDYITTTTTDEEGNKTTSESLVQGVYVKYGSEIVFKQVYIIHSDEEYVICSENPGSDVLVNGTTLSLYDEVVIEGDDLFDGKLID